MTTATAPAPRSTLPLLVGFAAAIALPLALLLAVVGLGPVGLLVGVVVGAAVTVVLSRGATPRALAANGAQLADPVTHARLHNVTEGLCVAIGLSPPDLYVIDDPAANALVVGVDARTSAVAVTTGLLEGLDRMELEGVLALALTEIKSGRLAVPTIAASLLGPMAGVPAVRRVLVRLGADASPSAADAAAVTLTRYPPGLLAALEKLAEIGAAPRAASPATAQLWIADPRGASETHASDSAHPPLDLRIAVLREL